MKAAVASYRSPDELSSASSIETSAIDIEKMKRQLGRLQEALMDAPEAERPEILGKVKEVKREMKTAVRLYKKERSEDGRSVVMESQGADMEVRWC